MGQRSNTRKVREWRCHQCANNPDHFHIAGISQWCANCGKYADSYYELKNGKWEVAFIFAIHDDTPSLKYNYVCGIIVRCKSH